MAYADEIFIIERKKKNQLWHYAFKDNKEGTTGSGELHAYTSHKLACRAKEKLQRADKVNPEHGTNWYTKIKYRVKSYVPRFLRDDFRGTAVARPGIREDSPLIKKKNINDLYLIRKDRKKEIERLEFNRANRYRNVGKKINDPRYKYPQCPGPGKCQNSSHCFYCVRQRHLQDCFKAHPRGEGL